MVDFKNSSSLNFLWNITSHSDYIQWSVVKLPDTAKLADDLVWWVSNPELPEKYQKIHSWKVRETYVNPDNENELLIIATDRISTHDVVHKSLIPWKWTALTRISNHFFDVLSKDEKTKHIPSQMVNPQTFPGDFPQELMERTIVVKRLKALPIEAIVRWYLYWSALKWYNAETWYLATWEYVWKDLVKCSKFNEPLFTPSIKVEKWHDVNVDYDQMVQELVKFFDGDEEKANYVANQIKEYSMVIYKTINEYATKRWVTLWDTKFEFWMDNEWKIYLIDEICTPDSSRYWTTSSIIPWKEPISHDKQPVRDEVVERSRILWKKAWDVSLYLSQDVIRQTMKVYWATANTLTKKVA